MHAPSHITAFLAWYTLYEWVIMLMGLMNAPAVFT